MQKIEAYKPKNHIRIVTAASLFDGHDAAINIMRRIIQSTGVEVIHLGHNRSVLEIVNCAQQEDAQAISITSYQGGHIEFFKYMYDLLKEKGRSNIKLFGGGGGVILPKEIEELQNYGITRIYSPDDGRRLGLQGMINDLMEKSDFSVLENGSSDIEKIKQKDINSIARMITAAECCGEKTKSELDKIRKEASDKNIPVLGITGTGGSGKSSLVDELVRRFIDDFEDKTIAIVSVDPSKRKTGGALLGDRIRMNAIKDPRVYMRSLATRQSNLALSAHIQEALMVLKAANFDLIILETSGIGQSDTEIIEHSDISLYVMTPEYGAATQLEKIDMLDFAEIIAINKFDKRGSLDALRDVKKQYKRNHNLFELQDEDLPVYGTIASQFNDPGMNSLYLAILGKINEKTAAKFSSQVKGSGELSEKIFVIPPNRTRYLSEIAENNRQYDKIALQQAKVAQELYSLKKSIIIFEAQDDKKEVLVELQKAYDELKLELDPKNLKLIDEWEEKVRKYTDDVYTFKVRGKEISIQTYTEALSHLKIPKIALPKYEGWGDLLKWLLQENVPGEFPYTAGIYPFKREGEDPTRMFAGEGGPERTNRRFHYVSEGMPAKRLSTAFDSVTLYGSDPDLRPDIYGKIGNAGVSVCCLDDAKKLYSGFNLADPKTSVSMTINGPAPMMLGYFMNAAIDQQCEVYIKENNLEKEVLKKIDAIYSSKADKRPKYTGDIPA
ncbi:MAG: methylmalonyl-CoA mutase family protein, partial [Cyclobacteriaceae bacterium]|nr:methylmalonyl-CoA mutase family protein [Cyclobacteriaceae bacterium]